MVMLSKLKKTTLFMNTPNISPKVNLVVNVKDTQIASILRFVPFEGEKRAIGSRRFSWRKAVGLNEDSEVNCDSPSRVLAGTRWTRIIERISAARETNGRQLITLSALHLRSASLSFGEILNKAISRRVSAVCSIFSSSRVSLRGVSSPRALRIRGRNSVSATLRAVSALLLFLLFLIGRRLPHPLPQPQLREIFYRRVFPRRSPQR